MNNHPPYMVKKLFDEGTTSPFPARLMLQMFNLRDSILVQKSDRSAFDEMYSPLLENFMELKLSVKKLIELKEQHLMEVQQGVAVKVHPNRQISILKPIDTSFRALLKEFFIKGEMVISAIPRVGKVFGLHVGFFFFEEKKIEKGAELLKNECANADFVLEHLRSVRSNWYNRFNTIRNDIEHRSFKLPTVEHHLDANLNVVAEFPVVEDGTDLIKVLDFLTQRVLELVECRVIFFFSTKLRPGQFIRDIPENERDPNKIVRYKLYMQFSNQSVPYGNS